MVEAYLAKLALCATPNQFNRLHIALECLLAPVEVCALIDGVRERALEVPPASVYWLDRMNTLLRGDGRRVQGYVRHAIAEGATAYAAPGDDRVRMGRTLVFAFTGDAGRLMMPISLFLQHCPDERYEFVLLTDTLRSYFLPGIKGLGDDLPTSIARLGDLCTPSRFARAIAFGTSAGGLATVWTAVALGLPRAVSVGGVTPAQVGERLRTQHMSTAGFDDAIRSATRLPEVLLVAGEHHERDQGKALVMSSLLPATTITVPGTSNHNVLFDVWKAGGLDDLLARLLG